MTETFISSSVLILLIIILRRILRKRVPNRVIYSLWLIVAIRLMISCGLPESTVSVMNFRKYKTEKVIASPVASETESPDIITESYISENNIDKIEKTDIIFPDSTGAYGNTSDMHDFLAVIRVIGMFMFLIWFSAVNIMFYIKLRRSRIRYEIKCGIPVYVTDDTDSPCIFGIFKPSIYLSKSALEQKNSIDYIISHEICHYKHCDLIWSVLRCILVSVWWFNPLVWVGAYLSKQDCECACDESVMKNLSCEQRIEYGRILLSLVNVKRPKILGNISTSMTSDGKRLKERIILIAENPRKSVTAQVIMTIAILMASVCTFTSERTSGEIIIHSENVTNYTDTHIKEPTENHIITHSEKVTYQDMAIELYGYAIIVYFQMLENGSYCQINENTCSIDDVSYYEVSDSEISSIADLKKTVRNYFSESLASQYDIMIEQNYIEDNGKLYQHTIDKNRDFASYYSVDFISKDEDTIYFQAVHYDPYAEEEIINYYQYFSITYENGEWKINSFEP